MSDENVFDQNTSDTNNNNNVATNLSPDPLADKLMSITNKDGKPKYDSVEKALEALVHSQTHIERLEAEAQERTAELERARVKAAEAEALEAVIDRLKPNDPPVEKQTPSNAGLSGEATIEQLESIIEKGLQKREAVKKAQDNFKVVNDTLLAKFGGDLEKTKEAVARKAVDLGLTTADLAALSSKSPAAVLAYFGEAMPRGNITVPSNNNPSHLPREDELKRPEKSLLLGAKSGEQVAFMKKIKEQVYKDWDVKE